MLFQDWIAEKGGCIPVAKMLGVTGNCVQKWRMRRHYPSPRYLIRLEVLSKGELRADQILKDCIPTEILKEWKRGLK